MLDAPHSADVRSLRGVVLNSTSSIAAVLLVLAGAAFFATRQRADSGPGEDRVERQLDHHVSAPVDDSLWGQTGTKRRDKPYRHGQDIKFKYDKFDDECEVAVQCSVEEDLNVFWRATWKGKRPIGWPKRLSAGFIAIGSSWRFLNSHRIVILADGRRHAPTVLHDGRVETGHLLEVIAMDLSPRELVSIAHAQVVEGKIGRTEFVMPVNARIALHDIFTRGFKKNGGP